MSPKMFPIIKNVYPVGTKNVKYKIKNNFLKMAIFEIIFICEYGLCKKK